MRGPSQAVTTNCSDAANKMNELLTKIAPFVELATFIIIYLVASLLSGERDGARGGGEEHCECCGVGGKEEGAVVPVG